MRQIFFLSLCLLHFVGFSQTSNIFEVTEGSISFKSEAPKELISASSTKLKGLLDVSKKAFVFKLSVATFIGFNSPLQQEHFNENYMETSQYPEVMYKGKIIDDIDFTKEGTYEVRTKGKLLVHGVETERIINVEITVQKNQILAKSNFSVLLQDYNVKIPRIVFEKLSSEIKVSMSASLKPKA